VIHVMDMLAQGRNLEDPKVKSEIAGQVMPLIEDVPDAVERDTYRQRLARLLKVNEAVLTGGYQGRQSRRARYTTPPHGGQGAPSAGKKQTAPAQPQLTSSSVTLEAHALGVLMRHPDMVFRVDRVMQEYQLPRLAYADFERAEHQAIFALVQESLDQDIAEPLNFVLSGLPFPIMDKADELLARTDKLDPVEEKVLEDLLRALLNLRILNVRESLEYYRNLLEETQQQEDKSLMTEHLHAVQQYTQLFHRLNKALGRYTSHSVDAKVKES
jgi:DNA primase